MGDTRFTQARRRWATGSPTRVLLQRDFGLYFAGQLVSNCGTWFQTLAQTLLIYRLTGSVFLVGVVNFAQFAGSLLLVSQAGRVADRFDRRRVLIATQAGSLIVSALLALCSALDVAAASVVIVLAGLIGIGSAFASPAQSALVPSLVAPSDLGAAIMMNSIAFSLARVIGPLAGALAVQQFGVTAAFGLNSLSFGAFLVVLLMLAPGERRGMRPAIRAPVRLRSTLALLRHDRRMSGLLAVVAVTSIAMDPVQTLTPAIATEVLGRPDTLTGVLIGFFGAGSVLAVLLPTSGPPIRQMRVGLALLVVGMTTVALADSLAVVAIGLATAGLGSLAAQTRATTALQMLIADEQRGRVMAIWSIAFLGTRPIASVVDGGLATLVGVRVATVAMCVPAAVIGIWLFLRWSGGEVTAMAHGSKDTTRKGDAA